MTDYLAKKDVKEIQQRILVFRGEYVMVDKDLAEIYEVKTKALNQAVKRNEERFPEDFSFQLTKQEKDQLVTNCDRLLINNENMVFHFGASLKDLGKKWFAFSKMERDVFSLLKSLKELI
ncbi:MAG: ORF6N domain-containing protein [Bacteroidales bacterium]|nr:ORF6N domain-containing protein [Bacteroidales bacterium]MCF8333801.1 ORF6N domain-containing protein [Bacteroidales bacterium]